jgi:cobalt/nickel transport system permease protein
MHIPSSMVKGPICPVTAIVGALGLLTALYFAIKSKNKPTAARFGAIAALIFVGQMMNFPIQNGTSGHLLGGVLASALLGTPFGVLATAMVLTIQCLVFSDGGISVLGANILNMSIIGAGLGGMLQSLLCKSLTKSFKYAVSIGFAAWLSVIAAAFACSLELSISGTIPFSKVVMAMLGTHALIGIGEGLITAVACLIFAVEPSTISKKKSIIAPLTTAGIIALMLSPFASGFPDGLEWVAAKYKFLHNSAPAFVRPLPNYTIPFVSNKIVSTGLAGLLGVGLTFLTAWAIGRLLTTREKVIS